MFGVDDAHRLHHIEMGGGFHRRTTRNEVVMPRIGSGAAPRALSDVGDRRLRGRSQLLGQSPVTLGEFGDNLQCESEELDGTLVHVEL